MIDSEDDLLSAAADLGADVSFVERGTLNRWRVSPSQTPRKAAVGEVLLHRGPAGAKKKTTG
jgi:hypothetical protein